MVRCRLTPAIDGEPAREQDDEHTGRPRDPLAPARAAAVAAQLGPRLFLGVALPVRIQQIRMFLDAVVVHWWMPFPVTPIGESPAARDRYDRPRTLTGCDGERP